MSDDGVSCELWKLTVKKYPDFVQYDYLNTISAIFNLYHVFFSG